MSGEKKMSEEWYNKKIGSTLSILGWLRVIFGSVFLLGTYVLFHSPTPKNIFSIISIITFSFIAFLYTFPRVWEIRRKRIERQNQEERIRRIAELEEEGRLRARKKYQPLFNIEERKNPLSPFPIGNTLLGNFGRKTRKNKNPYDFFNW